MRKYLYNIFNNKLIYLICIFIFLSIFYSCNDGDKKKSKSSKVFKQKIGIEKNEQSSKTYIGKIALNKVNPNEQKINDNKGAEKTVPDSENKNVQKLAETKANMQNDQNLAKTAATPEKGKPADNKEKPVDNKDATSASQSIQPISLFALDYKYNSSGKIDPFAPLFKKTAQNSPSGEKKAREKRAQLTPIEMVDLSQLKLSAIILSSKGSVALVEEASGKGYTIQEGTFIGIHSGQVKQILRDKVVVEEEIEDMLGNVTLQKRELKLLKPTGEE